MPKMPHRSVFRREPLVSEAEASHFSAAAKTISLVRSLELAHNSDASWQPPQAAAATNTTHRRPHTHTTMPTTKYSRALRQAIMFSTCGSYAANQVVMPPPPEDPFKPVRVRTLRRSYVDQFVDEWTVEGIPHMVIRDSDIRQTRPLTYSHSPPSIAPRSGRSRRASWSQRRRRA